VNSWAVIKMGDSYSLSERRYYFLRGTVMIKELVIIGAGGFGREASLLVEDINQANGSDKWNLLGFIDEDQAFWGETFRGYPVLGGWEVLAELPRDTKVICVVGDPAAKRELAKKALAGGRDFANLIHPEVKLAGDVEVGRGVLINKGCLLTTKIYIGEHVSVNPGCGIGHDAVIGDLSTLMWRVNISGNVRIGEGCLLGTGATVLQGLSVGAGTVIGAGAVVTKDIPGNCTAVGVPAQVIKGESK
jgi:sugar O-acyltransferase (sialic acid O-acetyltransferase NeuD family)